MIEKIDKLEQKANSEVMKSIGRNSQISEFTNNPIVFSTKHFSL